MSDNTDSGPPRPDEDAVSLHTIAHHEFLTSQEREDADFALALSLEDEEQDRARELSQLTALAQDREALIAREEQEEQSQPRDAPYRDDENDDAIPGDNFPPYRDDPDADERLDDGNVEAQELQAFVEEGRYWPILRRYGKMLLDYLGGFVTRDMICGCLSRVVVTTTIVGIMLFLICIPFVGFGPLFQYLRGLPASVVNRP